MERRRAAVDRRQPWLSVVRQCRLLGISRSGLPSQPGEVSEEDLTLMKMIARQSLATPFYGARRLAAWLRIRDTGSTVNVCGD